MSKKIPIMSSIFLFSIAITLIDAFVHPNYFVKIPIKILFFLALPMLFFVKNKEVFKDFKKMFVLKKDGILKALLLGVGVYAVIVGGYFLTRNVIDFSRIATTARVNLKYFIRLYRSCFLNKKAGQLPVVNPQIYRISALN